MVSIPDNCNANKKSKKTQMRNEETEKQWLILFCISEENKIFLGVKNLC